tara:strand:- start:4309 stop:4461 length:153 start_codon:yes stop_codon:yes gene_type:complete
MKKDINILLKYLREYTNAFNNASINLKSEDEDTEMNAKIREIAKKHNLEF